MVSKICVCLQTLTLFSALTDNVSQVHITLKLYKKMRLDVWYIYTKTLISKNVDVHMRELIPGERVH